MANVAATHMNARVKMLRKPLSLYLDFLRILASVAVVVGHARHTIATSIPGVFSHASEAVAVFFVLSGFVIRYVTSEREGDVKSYANARAIRIYSVVGIAIIFTVIFDGIGVYLNPAYYQASSIYNPNNTLENIVRVLTFSNEWWFSHNYIGTGEPIWSLGFEVPYYIIFGVIVFGRGILRIALVIAWVAICGPKIALYLPLWWLGTMTYDLTVRSPPSSRMLSLTVLLATLFAYLALKYFYRGANGIFHFDDVGVVARSAIYFYGIGIIVSINLIAFNAAFNSTIWPQWAERSIRWFAGGSFTLYLIHQPILVLIAAVFPGVNESLALGILGLVATIVISLGIAELGERRKNTFKALFRKAASLKL